eukprot:TRINITY_DN1284_c0_g1_i3.p1 TRINITY_DN1284_c0_g1~~TRINITY_DN1284_c0_g1_i3.p1  ORF type:complete len:233 (-),score=-12.74 TRINITY_DN1284_c0_g1_i3:1143-1772(-)
MAGKINPTNGTKIDGKQDAVINKKQSQAKQNICFALIFQGIQDKCSNTLRLLNFIDSNSFHFQLKFSQKFVLRTQCAVCRLAWACSYIILIFFFINVFYLKNIFLLLTKVHFVTYTKLNFAQFIILKLMIKIFKNIFTMNQLILLEKSNSEKSNKQAVKIQSEIDLRKIVLILWNYLQIEVQDKNRSSKKGQISVFRFQRSKRNDCAEF